MKSLCSALILVFCLAAVLPAQRQPHTVLKQEVGLSDGDIAKMDKGEVVVKQLDSADKYGFLVFGGAYINGSIDDFVEVFQDVDSLEKEKVYEIVHRFGGIQIPALASDFARLQFTEADLDDLEDCKPGNCDLQVMDVQSLQKQVDWSSSDKYDQANKIIRERVAKGINEYYRGGLKTLGAYRDRKKPFDLDQQTRAMVDGSFYLPEDRSAGIYGHIVDFPNGRLEGATDHFYWEQIDFGQGPVVRVNHLSIFPEGAGAAKAIGAIKQLYASKYMRLALQVFYCVPDTGDAGRKGFYLIEMNDSRVPDFGGLKLTIVKKIAVATAKQATEDTLNIYKRRVEKP